MGAVTKDAASWEVPAPPPRGEDLPFDDGMPLESERHLRAMTLLIDSLGEHWRDRQDFYVGGNMFIYFSELQAKHNDFRGPDVFVVLNTERRERKSWVVWEENGRTPDVVIEVISPSSAGTDRGIKKKIYAQQMKVARYFLYDPFEATVEGYALRDGAYLLIEPDANGRLPVSNLGLSLGVLEGTAYGIDVPWLRWFDGDTPLPTPNEIADKQIRRSKQEAERAQQEAERAGKEALRATQEAERAQHEASRADALAEKLAAYEAAFGTLPDP